MVMRPDALLHYTSWCDVYLTGALGDTYSEATCSFSHVLMLTNNQEVLAQVRRYLASSYSEAV